MADRKKDKPKFRFGPATFVDLKILRATPAVELQFLDQHNDPFAVTIPLAQLQRLDARVQRLLQKEQELFSLASRKVLP